MFSKCSNPNCATPFDFRQGRLIRFHKPPLYFHVPLQRGCVEHFWLCENCAKFYAFDFEYAAGRKIRICVIGPPQQVHDRLLPVAGWKSNQAENGACETEACAMA